MAQVSGKKGRQCYGEHFQVVIPSRTDLGALLDQSDLRKYYFPTQGNSKKIESYKAIIESEEGNIVELTITADHDKQKLEQFRYMHESKKSDYLTLQMTAVGTNKKTTENIIEKIYESLPGVKNFNLKTNLSDLLNYFIKDKLNIFNSDQYYYKKWKKIKKELSNITQEKPIELNKYANNNFLYNIVNLAYNQVLNKFDVQKTEEDREINLVNRINANYKGVPVELSLIYINNRKENSGKIQGILLKNIRDEKVNNNSDYDIYVGYLFQSEIVSNILKREKPRIKNPILDVGYFFLGLTQYLFESQDQIDSESGIIQKSINISDGKLFDSKDKSFSPEKAINKVNSILKPYGGLNGSQIKDGLRLINLMYNK